MTDETAARRHILTELEAALAAIHALDVDYAGILARALYQVSRAQDDAWASFRRQYGTRRFLAADTCPVIPPGVFRVVHIYYVLDRGFFAMLSAQDPQGDSICLPMEDFDALVARGHATPEEDP